MLVINIPDELTITILGTIYRPVLYTKHNISETGVCLRFQVEPTQLNPLDRTSLYVSRSRSSPEDGHRILSPKRRVLNKRQTMDNVQNLINIQSSKTYRSYSTGTFYLPLQHKV
jgi:hypothetical protein